MVMQQTQKGKQVGQVEYMGRWVDKQNFRTFVYNIETQKLAESFEEYQLMISSGLWFDTKEFAIKANTKITPVEALTSDDISTTKQSTRSKVRNSALGK